MSGFDPARAADALLDARRTRHWLADLPGSPANDIQATAIQDHVARHTGAVAGWKVGAASPAAEPFRAPLHATTISRATRLPAAMFHLIGVEAELVYHFGRDLPPRDAPYDAAELRHAITAIHPAIEIVDTRFVSLEAAGPLGQRADQQNHGALVIGPALTAWRDIDPLHQPVTLTLNGRPAHDGIGGNSAGDPLRLLLWLANIGTVTLGGLRAGHVVTTGSCSGTIFVQPGTTATAHFAGIGEVTLLID